jgi:hypothetical protein
MAGSSKQSFCWPAPRITHLEEWRTVTKSCEAEYALRIVPHGPNKCSNLTTYYAKECFQGNILGLPSWNDDYGKDVPVRKRQQTLDRLPVSQVQIMRMINHNTRANGATFPLLNIERTQHATHVSARRPTYEIQNPEF